MSLNTSQFILDDAFGSLDSTDFDPVSFLNDSLPVLNLNSQGSASKQTRGATLQSTSTDVQAFLSKLNTHSVRSSSDLTTVTDEILRSGNRLAYEVEVLRGDVNSLYELLNDSLKDDISRFVLQEVALGTLTDEVLDVTEELKADATRGLPQPAKSPDFIRQLRTLGNVKSRLESVITVFGEALKWPIAPSDVSVATTLISVSAPELGIMSTAEDDTARDWTRRLRNQVTESLESDGGGYTGLEVASKKVDDLRILSHVWKGTTEEKARTRIVDSLTKLIEDRRRILDARSAALRSNPDGSGARSSSTPGRAGRLVEGSTNTAAGLFRNLQKLRDEMYLD